jgi:hypothetical protein
MFNYNLHLQSSAIDFSGNPNHDPSSPAVLSGHPSTCRLSNRMPHNPPNAHISVYISIVIAVYSLEPILYSWSPHVLLVHTRLAHHVTRLLALIPLYTMSFRMLFFWSCSVSFLSWIWCLFVCLAIGVFDVELVLRFPTSSVLTYSHYVTHYHSMNKYHFVTKLLWGMIIGSNVGPNTDASYSLSF